MSKKNKANIEGVLKEEPKVVSEQKNDPPAKFLSRCTICGYEELVVRGESFIQYVEGGRLPVQCKKHEKKG